MNLQPTIFLSSIITEFYDLRGALKYFLGKSGFRVLMSEESDFGADCNKDSLDNCKMQIEASDYYFLIIGTNPGFQFDLVDGMRTTVTLEEFRHFLLLKNQGKKLNLIAFVRSQAWNFYSKKDFKRMPEIQHQFIDELVNNSLVNQKIGRWRYTFDKFSDIISVIETNQNGLFTEASRKVDIYRIYLKNELIQIMKSLVLKQENEISTVKEVFQLPEIKFNDFLDEEKIPRQTAIYIKSFVISYSQKEDLLLKINRIFNYIAQGEFAVFNPENEKYELPGYIKSTIQVLEILERVFINFKNIESYKEIAEKDHNNFWINEFKYGIIKGKVEELDLVTLKIINILLCLENNWPDFNIKDEKYYEYRGGTFNEISNTEIINFAQSYFQK